MYCADMVAVTVPDEDSALFVMKSSPVSHVFIRGSIADKALVDGIFAQYRPAVVVNLAAQAGVRYSIDWMIRSSCSVLAMSVARRLPSAAFNFNCLQFVSN